MSRPRRTGLAGHRAAFEPESDHIRAVRVIHPKTVRRDAALHRQDRHGSAGGRYFRVLAISPETAGCGKHPATEVTVGALYIGARFFSNHRTSNTPLLA